MNNTFSKNSLDKIKHSSLNWNLIQTEMKNKLGVEVYESWLKKINLIEDFNNYVLLSVPTRFIRDWITSRYLDQILKIIRLHKKDIIRIEFKIIEENKQSQEFIKIEELNKVTEIKDSILNYNRLNPNLNFDSFIQVN